jgi:DNA-binding CsgD family transcriptional regulator
MSGRMTINDRDLHTMLGIANDTGDAKGQQFPDSVMTGLIYLIGCDRVTFTQFDARDRIFLACQDVGGRTLPAAEEAEMDQVFWRHYWTSVSCCYPDVSGDLTTVTTVADFFTDRQWRASPMYNEYLKDDAGYREMMLCLPGRPGHIRRMLFWRASGSNFSDRDRALLTLLRPHLDRIHRTRQNSADVLTRRQRELLGLVAAGHTNGQIARRLSISEATVRKHLENIFARLGVTSRTAAVAEAFLER